MANEVFDFLKDNAPFYLASIKGNTPKLRPLGLVLDTDGKIYFGVGDQKEVYRQIVDNPNVEIATTNKEGNWIRISGTVVFDENPALFEKAADSFPPLKEMYTSGGPKLGIFYLKNATALFLGHKGEITKTINF
jgi:uncharacterized pyridoxamine 5'-phosphate oxidase family protein